MASKQSAVMMVLLLLLSLPSHTAQAEDTEMVDAFGDGFR